MPDLPDLPDMPDMRRPGGAVEVVARLLALTEEQSTAVRVADWPRFQALLEDRQQVMATPGLAAHILAGTADERTQVMTLLARIEQLDAEHREAIDRERSQLLQELPGLEAGRRAAAAYRERAVSSAYVDASS